ncbi:MAG: RNA polymerase sigma factor [Nitrospiraceae bacterium]
MRQGHASDEPELIARSLKQDRDAFGTLVERYADAVFSLVCHMVGPGPAARDLTEETFVCAFQTMSAFQAGSGFSTWLFRIAVTRCHTCLRSGHAGQQSADGDSDAEMMALYAPASQDPHEQAPHRFDQTVQRLPLLHREAFILKHVEGCSYEEIGDILMVGRETAKMRVYKARRRLCEELIGLRDHG